MRWLALGAGLALVTVAFLAGARVADTREGLIYEVVTLLAGLAGVSLLLYGLVAALGRQRPLLQAPNVRASADEKVHNAAELAVGASGLVVAAILLAGVSATAGVLWAMLGSILLLPMIAGCAYLCISFVRGPRREWKIDLRSLMSHD
ncbi:MAG: hypothetical protein AUJ02_01840 [Chloroflexi bacterium 13_1_40CM_3_65_12]|nr:MAG: hypothetical protein AUJ02_01840 [Chloroflexi bacterium 13_1_40CM_3_65_12]